MYLDAFDLNWTVNLDPDYSKRKRRHSTAALAATPVNYKGNLTTYRSVNRK